MDGLRFDDDLKQYVCEYNGIMFAWDEEPVEYGEMIEKLSNAYWDKIDSIARYISAEIEEILIKQLPFISH